MPIINHIIKYAHSKCSTNLSVKNVFLILNLTLPWYSFMLFPQDLSLSPETVTSWGSPHLLLIEYHPQISTLVSRLCIKSLMRTSPIMDPWGTPLMTVCLHDIITLTIALWPWLVCYHTTLLSSCMLDVLHRVLWDRESKALLTSKKITTTGFPWSTRWVVLT